MNIRNTPKHYDAELVVSKDNFIAAVTDREHEHFDVGGLIRPVLTSQTYQIRATGYEVRVFPGEKLQALIDLGYTEAEGVKMLDALEPSEVGRG